MKKPLSNATIETLENGDKILTFNDARSFKHWLKRQRKTSFSVPMHMQNANYCHQYITVTKQSLAHLRLDDKEVVEVHLGKAKRGDRYYAFVEPKRLRGEKK